MLSRINALVIGVGYFGRHHARILSRLNAKGISSVPVIDKLIVTRTDLGRASAVAESIAKSSSRVTKVIGAEVGNMQQLIASLEKYRPSFISIAARDRDRGDSIHADYSVRALKYGAVLCEKPFSQANGDGTSLRYFKELRASENSKFFGMELPLAVVCRDMMKDRNLRKIIMRASRLEFYWEAWDRGENRIIDDLVLHPWSLIPSDFTREIRRVEDRGTSANLVITLHHRKTDRKLPCKMTLKIGPGFRGLQINELPIGIKSESSRIQLIKLNQPLEQAAQTGRQALNGNVLLTVDNPLEQNIVAVLSHRPIVGLRQTYESQLFLETLHGYTATQADIDDIHNLYDTQETAR